MDDHITKVDMQLEHDVVVNENLEYFHLHDNNGKIVGVYDANIFSYLICVEHIFFLNETPYIYEDGIYLRDSDGAILMTKIKDLIYPRFQKISTIRRVYGLFEKDMWLKRSISDLNKYPPEWIIFKDCIYNAKTKEVIKHDPTYLAINQIPHEYKDVKNASCKYISKWLDTTLTKQEKEMFLEYSGLCMTKDTRQQRFLLFTGEGGTGKSIFINLVASMVGDKNTSSIDLKSLAENRFASFNLFQKLLNCCSDIDKAALTSTANIKLLTGEDTISGEPKGKQPINFKNYAKLLFSANEIPRIKGENTEAFYRRLLVIRIKRKPDKVNPNLFNTLSKEMNAFIGLCLDALYNLYQRGIILEADTSKEATYKLRLWSDSVEAFLFEKTVKCIDGKINGKDLHEAYKNYCVENELTPVQKQNFFKACDDKGYSHIDGRTIRGLKWKPTNFEPDNNEAPF